MFLEYLFFEEELKQDIQKYKQENIEYNVTDINESEYWIGKFIVNLEDKERNASILSNINQEIVTHYEGKYVTLTNEASHYYNKELYPLINKFERKLRKTIYLAIKLTKENEKSEESQMINDLEGKNLGTIFDIIFTDDEFNKELRKNVNDGGFKHNKSQILDKLSKIREKTLWNEYLGDKNSPTLQKEFNNMRDYRNKVMHAHNINEEDYNKIKNVYSLVNEELDNVIDDILDQKLINLYDENKTERFKFNDALSNRLKEINNGLALEQIKEMQESIQSMINNPAFEQIKETQENFQSMINNSAFEQIRETQKGLQSIINNPEINQIRKAEEKSNYIKDKDEYKDKDEDKDKGKD